MLSSTIVHERDGSLFTDSEIVALNAGVEHRAVLQLITTHADDLNEFGTFAFEMRKSGGRPTRIALLNEQQATLLLTYLRNTEQVRAFKKNLVKAFFDMAQQLAGHYQRPLTEDEIVAHALQITQKKVRTLEVKVAEQAPKVDYVNTYCTDEDTLSFSDVAATLRITEKELRAQLIDAKWIYRDVTTRWSNKNAKKVTVYRYTEYADKKKYFYRKKVHEAPRFRGDVMHTLKITPPGAEAIKRLIARRTKLTVVSTDG